MHDHLIDGKLQIYPAVALLAHSKIVTWDINNTRFAPVDAATFDYIWQHSVDPVFGRLICWINFSAGAEFLAKGVCLLNSIEIRSPKDYPAYPRSNATDPDYFNWANEFVKDDKFAGTIPGTDFGPLGGLLPHQNQKLVNSPLWRLGEKHGANQADKTRLVATYMLLTQTIRNRDAHAYVPGVRGDHYYLVSELFSKAFNLLVSWLPLEDGSSMLENWETKAELLVQSLKPVGP